MSSFARIHCILVSVLLISFSGALDQRSVSIALRGPLKNLRIFNEKLYIGGSNMIYVLNKDLGINQSASTRCRSKTVCSNVNQVLLVNEKRRELLVCGTGNDGLCEIRSTENTGIVLRNNSGFHAPLKVSVDRSCPAQAVLTEDGHFTFAVTFGKGIVVKTSQPGYLTYEYAISTRKFVDFEPLSTQRGTKVLLINIKKTSFSDYIIYYKAVFQYNWYTYFVTNQKKFVGDTKYLSKFVRLCQNDTDYNSYTDIVLSCSHKGVEYNLIQDSVLLEAPGSVAFAGSSRIFVGAFTRGNDPTNSSGDSVICMTKLTDMDDDILRARKKHAFSCKDQDLSERYLPNLKTSSTCFREKQPETREYNFSCENAYPTFLYVIGNVTLTMTSSYLLPAEKGSVTALHGAINSAGQMVIIAGTSAGYIVQMALKSLDSPLDVFSEVNLRKPIQSVHIQDDDTIYVMSSKNVFLFSRSNCSEYSTCSDTMAGRNPLCGWCVYKQRATRKSNCSDEPNHWLSSLLDCRFRMYVTPSSVPVNVSSHTNVTVTMSLERLPNPRAADKYQCRISSGTTSIETDIRAERNGSVFSCVLPFIEEHVEATLGLSVHTAANNSIVLSEASILFFDCALFSRCGDCIGRSNQHCDWCTEETTCRSHGSPCTADLRSSTDVCPTLLDTRGRHFVHADVLTSVHFHGKHIPTSKTGNKYVYTCKMAPVAESSTAVAFNDSIFCSINVSSDQPKQDYSVNIYYGVKGQRKSDLEDDFANYVTVYNCTLLAKDCSQCRALNTARYNCEWCANKKLCGYRDENCLVSTCPAPNITMVVPRDGPVTGHTKITFYGSNLGSNLSEVDSVQVADVPCKLSDDITQFLAADHGDFVMDVPNRLICYTGETANETTGHINVTVNGQSSIPSAVYSYRIPVVTGIVPQYGPKAGGTRVSVYGVNLGIGNRNIRILLGDKHCLRPEVRPDLPLETVHSGNFSIVCTVGGGYSGNITTVTLFIDGKMVVSKASISFRFVADPILHPISPKKAFLSGGTKITIEGMKLNNAHNARITLTYGHESEIGDCNILSETWVICKVPRAPSNLRKELLNMAHISKLSKHIKVVSVLHLDNIQEDVEIIYYRDPTIDNFPGNNNVVQFEAGDRNLRITGKMLNKVATISDINITVGVESCVIVELTSLNITCIAPKSPPKPGMTFSEYPEVNVTIGNIHRSIGYVQYVGNTGWISNPVVILSAAAVAAILILIISIATVLICRQYRRIKSRLRYLVKQNSVYERPNIIPLDRLAPNLDKEDKHMSNMYSDINEPSMADIYNTLAADDQKIDKFSTGQLSQQSLPEHLQGDIQFSQHSLPEHLQGDIQFSQHSLPEYLQPGNVCSQLPQHSLSDHLQGGNIHSQHSVRVKNKITVEIQLEGATATDVTLVPEVVDEQSYLHAVSYETEQ